MRFVSILFIIFFIMVNLITCNKSTEIVERNNTESVAPEKPKVLSIRESVIAGSWYPDEPSILRELIESFLSVARRDRNIVERDSCGVKHQRE